MECVSPLAKADLNFWIVKTLKEADTAIMTAIMTPTQTPTVCLWAKTWGHIHGYSIYCSSPRVGEVMFDLL